MKLDELERLASAATPGPWDWYSETGITPFVCTYSEDSKGNRALKGSVGVGSPKVLVKDVQYIAAANPDTVLKLIAVAKAAKRYKNAKDAVQIGPVNHIRDCTPFMEALKEALAALEEE